MQCNSVPLLQQLKMEVMYRDRKWHRRIPQCSLLVEDEMPNATTAMGMDIMLGNAHQHQNHHRKVEDRCGVEYPPGDREADEVEDDEGDVEIPRCQRMPHWRSRNQWDLSLSCNKHRSLLQCPVLHRDRETSCALPWPA